jgi:hypothetical protein
MKMELQQTALSVPLHAFNVDPQLIALNAEEIELQLCVHAVQDIMMTIVQQIVLIVFFAV